MVSQTSEKRVPGSRLVTRTGRLTGTLELRRRGAGEFALCMVTAISKRVRIGTLHVRRPALTYPYLLREPSSQECCAGLPKGPTRTQPLVTSGWMAHPTPTVRVSSR